MAARLLVIIITVLGLSGMTLALSGCAGTGPKQSSQVEGQGIQAGQAQVREEPSGYTPEWEQDFLTDCRQTCQTETTHPERKAQMAQFCELYCKCTHTNLRAGVPFEDLNAYGQEQINSSWARIEQIRQQCARDARTAVSIPVNQSL